MDEYLKFTEALGKAKYRYFDYGVRQWICDNPSALEIQKNLEGGEMVGSHLKLKPYGYQREAMAFCLNHVGALLQLPCGSGKTPIGLGIFDELIRAQKLKPPGIFVVKASLKSQWLREVSKFTDYTAVVVRTYKSVTAPIEGKIRRREKARENLIGKDSFENVGRILEADAEIRKLYEEADKAFEDSFGNGKADIFIVNYEAIADEKVREKLHALKPDFWYIDEADCIKDPSTKRSKNLREFTEAKFKYGATATPIRKNPKDLYGIFSFLIPSLFPSERKFDDRYMRFWHGRPIGSQNEAELAAIVRPHRFMRSFTEISSQLPQQSVVQLHCELTPKQIQMTKQLMELKDETTEQMENLAMHIPPERLEQNAEYQRLKGLVSAYQTFAQELADDERLLAMSESGMAKRFLTRSPSAKLELCMDTITRILDSGEKVCIFSRFVPMQKIIAERLDKLRQNKAYAYLKYSCISGSVTETKRAEILEAYNQDPNQRVLLLSDAGEAGLNLSTTKYMIEFELADSAAKQTQRHGRIQRADSVHKNVIVYQLIADGSYDEIAQMIVNKKKKYSRDILS